MKFLKSIFKKPVTIMFCIIIALVLGIVSTSSMAVNLLPDISFPFLCVQAVYAGADAETVDEKVTTPLENALSQVSGIHDVATYSIDNASIIMLQFNYGTNTEKKETELRKKIDNVILPDGCETPTISNIDLNSTSLYSLTVYSSDDSMDEVYQKALNLQSKLQSIEGVAKVKLSGAPTRSVQIETINGLEMYTGLLVKALSTNASLDIPLGNLKDENGKITINNTSKEKTIEEIEALPINVDIDTQTMAKIVTAQQYLNKIEELNIDDLETFKETADDMNKIINKIEDADSQEMDDLISNVSTIKALTTLVENYSATTLRLMYSLILKNLFENEDFKNMTDDELHDLSSNIGIDYYILKWLQDNAEIDPNTGKPYAEGKWDILVQFREDHPDEILDTDYPTLFYDLEIFSSDINDEKYMSSEDIVDAIKFSKAINIISLQSIANKKQNDEEITNSDYAALFIYENASSPITLNSTVIEIIRSEYFNDNYSIFYNYKKAHCTYNDATSSYDVDLMPSEDYCDLYNQMTFDTPLPIKPTPKLVTLLREIDTSNNSLTVTVDQVADVYIKNEYETSAYYNSQQAIQIDIYGASSSNATAISKEAKKYIKEFNNSSSTCVAVSLNNQAAFINDSLSNALTSLLIGSLLAVAVIYLFLRKVKSSIIIAISMPLSVLLTLICLYAMGITLNMVSVGGIAVGIGMLVDNSIVVLESITREKENGKDVLTASVDGVKLVIGSLIGSTLTSVCVFFPILLIEGLTKEIFSDLAYAVIFSLSFSLLVAILVIPTLFCLFYRKNKKNEKPSEGKIFKKIDNWYVNKLGFILKHKGITILIAMGVFLASIGLVFTCPIEFLPSIDQHKIQVNVSFDPGEQESYCQEKTMEAYEIISSSINDIDYISQSVGFSGLIETNQSGTIVIQLTNKAKSSKKVVEDIREALEANNFNQEYSVVEQDGVVASLTGGMNGISVTLSGEDVDVLQEIASQVEEDVMTKKGIKHAYDNMLSSSTAYNISFDEAALVEYNIDYTTLVQTLRIGLASYKVSEIVDDESSLDVKVSWTEDAITSYYGSLDKFVVGFDNDGNTLYLSDVASIEETSGRHIIRKSNGLNTITITVEAYGIDTNTASKYLNASAKKILKDYDGYSYISSGVAYYLTDAFKGLITALIISFFLLFGVMACLFESLRKPLIIIFSFPFAFTGGFLFLAITRVSLNVVSFIGLIMLMGVIINDAIVLNERFDQLRDAGLEPTEAVKEGCRQRLRAVLMTTLTTVLALIPMALGIGKGGALMQPLGVVAIGGMTIGTLVTLILIPCAYSVVYRISYKNK